MATDVSLSGCMLFLLFFPSVVSSRIKVLTFRIEFMDLLGNTGRANLINIGPKMQQQGY